MGVAHGVGDCAQVAGGAARIQGPAVRNLRKVPPLHQLHRVEWLAFEFAVVVDRHNAGMAERSGGSGLDLEAPKHSLARVHAAEQEFQRHDPV